MGKKLEKIVGVPVLAANTPRSAKAVTRMDKNGIASLVIEVFSRRLRKDSDEFVRHVIAHELMHAMFSVNDGEDEEAMAYSYASELGFPCPPDAKYQIYRNAAGVPAPKKE